MKSSLKKSFVAVALVLGAATISHGQVKIGDNPVTINPSAALEIESTNKGFLPPRVSLVSLTDGVTIPNPATGLIVYNTNANLVNGTGLYINAGTPAAPDWGKVESNTATTGGSSSKLVYRGAPDPTKIINAGSFQFRFRFAGGYNRVDARLISQPSQTITIVGDRIAWYSTTNLLAVNTSWTLSDWNQWKEIDNIGNASHLYYLNVTGEDRFYRVSSSVRLNSFNSLLVETF